LKCFFLNTQTKAGSWAQGALVRLLTLMAMQQGMLLYTLNLIKKKAAKLSKFN